MVRNVPSWNSHTAATWPRAEDQRQTSQIPCSSREYTGSAPTVTRIGVVGASPVRLVGMRRQIIGDKDVDLGEGIDSTAYSGNSIVLRTITLTVQPMDRVNSLSVYSVLPHFRGIGAAPKHRSRSPGCRLHRK